jgi:pimeloyl-ACP methyl ester carboxylesterase
VPLVNVIPGLLRAETGRLVAAADGGEQTYYRVAEPYFADQGALQAGFGSEEGKAEIDQPDSRWPQVMAAIEVPTLVIGGGASSFLPQEHVEELAKTVAHGTRVTIDAGHLVHATKPDAFLATVTAFLNA